MIFGCLLSTGMNALLPEFYADKVISALSSNLLSEDDASFVHGVYNPQVAIALRDVRGKIPHDEMIKLVRRATGMLMKLGYAFAFQE